MSLDSAKQTFAQEAAELLEAMEDALLSLEQAPDDEELLHQVFRAMHTIKGTAGVFGYEPIVQFTHTVESVMDDVRSGERPMDESLIAILLDCRDHTANLVDQILAADESSALDTDMLARGHDLIARLTGESSKQVITATTKGAEQDDIAIEKLQGPSAN